MSTNEPTQTDFDQLAKIQSDYLDGYPTEISVVKRDEGECKRKPEIKFTCTQQLYDFLKKQAEENGYRTNQKYNVAKYLRETLLTIIEEGKFQTVHVPEPSAELLKQLMILNNQLNEIENDQKLKSLANLPTESSAYEQTIYQIHHLISIIAKEITAYKPTPIIIGEAA
ncbi:MAG: hypothetical protein OQK09_14730 [Colwellia sp.]|nr:hypothetical protein [Colwellia sp.]MCW9082763.1 hypothetical protein [Colwellia sp.]